MTIIKNMMANEKILDFDDDDDDDLNDDDVPEPDGRAL